MIKNYYTMLPNNIVWAYEEGEVPLIKDYDKLLITMIYLDTHVNNIGQCCFTLEDLIIKSNFNVDRGKGKSIEQFKNTLIYLQSLRWLESTLDINSLKPKEFLCCTYEVKFKQDEADNDTCYFKLYYDNFKKIMANDSKLDKLITLKIYCYILARIKRNNVEQQEEREDFQNWKYSVIESFYDSYKVICKDLDTTDTTFNLHIQLLQDLELIFFDNIGLVKNEYGTHYANNVYTETKDWLKQALSASREYYLGQGYECIGKKCSKQTNKIKGYKGQIEKQSNEGKDTKELEDKLEELEEFKDNVKVVKSKNNRGTGNIIKKPEPIRPPDASPIISCQEDNYFEVSNKIESGEDDWNSNPFDNPYESSLKQMFGDDTYKMEIPKNEIQTNEFKNEYEKHRDSSYADMIDEILLQK